VVKFLCFEDSGWRHQVVFFMCVEYHEVIGLVGGVVVDSAARVLRISCAFTRGHGRRSGSVDDG
jgi:hypothetical protein